MGSGSASGGGNSGFQLLSLITQFGCNPIVLVGFDMRVDRGLHWHGAHKNNNPSQSTVNGWREALDGVAPTFLQLGVTVLNANRHSALTAYEVIDLAEWTNELAPDHETGLVACLA